MSVLQGLLDFGETSADFSDDCTRTKVFDILRAYNAKGPVVSTYLDDGNGYLFVFLGPDGGHWTLRSYPNGHISLDVVQITKENGEASISQEEIDELKKTLSTILKCKTSRALPPIVRKGPFDPYIGAAKDGLIIQYDIDRVVVDVDSQYQNIKILHSKQFGNILILDDDLNLAESDIQYTKAITGSGRENFKNKTVLVLGGGDGGILNELLKQQPKFVVMAEIDKLVIDLSKKHLRRICGDAMDSLTGHNYKILIGDCIEVMNKFINEGRTFDYVINDLTAIPITTEPRGSEWDFLRLILDLSMKLLSLQGRYFTQGNGFNNTGALAMYEEQLRKLESAVEFSTEAICVPSYHEFWVFYEIWKKNEKSDIS